MPLTPVAKDEILSKCTHFLRHERSRPVADQLRRIAESPHAQMTGDMYGRGGYIEQFEAELVQMLGKEAAVFMPSGTMAQQIALRLVCDWKGLKTVAFHPTCHLEIHEQMAYRELHGLKAVVLGEKDRLFTIGDLQDMQEEVAVLLIELPQREIGGQLPRWDELVEICEWARTRGIWLHLDGARLWECKPYYGRDYAEICSLFDSVYVSFYKILAGLPGAGLAGPVKLIEESRIWQRRHGGNLQQQSPSAIAAKLGLEERLPKIPLYVKRAQEIARVLRSFDRVRVVPEDPPTNMFHLFIRGDKEQLESAAWEVAKRTGLFVFGGLGASDDPNEHKLEIVISDGAMEVSDEQVRSAFGEILEGLHPG